MCASFQLIASYTSHWTWGVRFYEDSRNFSLTLPNGNEESALAKHPADFLLLLSTADEKCVWEIIGTLFWKAFLTLHYRGFESRLGEKTENFFWKIFCSYYLLEVNSRFGRKLLNFLSSLSTGHEKCVWAKESETFFKNFWSHSLLEAGDPSGPLIGRFFFFTYMGKMSIPTAHWRKSGCLNEKRMLLSKSFSHWSIWTGIGVLAESFEYFSDSTHYRRRDAEVVRFSGNFFLLPISQKRGLAPKSKNPYAISGTEMQIGA